MAESSRPSAGVSPSPPAYPPKRSGRPPKPPQFSLRAMLIAMTAFAGAAAVSNLVGFGFIASLAAALLFLLLVPASLATLAFYSRGRRQTFFAGAFAGSLSAYFIQDNYRWGSSALEAAALTVMGAIAILSTGFTALYTRRFLESRGWHLPPATQGSEAAAKPGSRDGEK